MTDRPVRSDRRAPTVGGRAGRPSSTAQPPGRTYRTVAAPPAVAAPKANPTPRNPTAAWWAQWDLPLLAIVGVMLAFGLVMVFSATYFRAGAYYFQRQLGWVALGLVVMFILARVPIGWWPRLAIPMMIAALISLAAVYLLSDERFGSRRTFFGSIQPSEFAKLAVAVYVAAWAASKGRQLADVRGGLIPFAILIGLVASLIAIEPNLSTTLVVLAIGLVIFFVGGADVRQLLVVLAIGAVMFVLLIWQSPYALERITDWWNMLADPSMAPENVRRAIELMRRRDGLLPDASVWNHKLSVALLWSDFLFANIGSDVGLVGQLAVVALYAGLGYRGLGIALRSADRFGSLLAIGVTSWILTQAAIHIGTSLALIPATGQPLPFMSYGGSAMVAALGGIGLLLGVARNRAEKRTFHADLAIGGRDGRTRVPDPVRGGRTGGGRRPAEREPEPRRATRR